MIKPILLIIVTIGIGQSIRLAWLDLHTTQAKTFNRLILLEKQLIDASPEKKVELQSEISVIERSEFSLKSIRWDIASLAIVFGFVALIPPAFFWWLTLRSFDYPVPWFPTQSAYATGILGKYVPGKAMVLILRSGAMQRWGVPISTTIVSIFIETLTSLAVGGALVC